MTVPRPRCAPSTQPFYTEDVPQARVHANDPNGGEVTLSYLWRVDDVIIDESSAMLASVNFSKGNSVTVTAHAADLEGVPVSDQIVVFNTPPPTPSIALDALNRWCAIHYLGKESWNEEVSAAGSDSLSFTDALTVELWVWTAIQEDTDPIVLFAQSNVQNKSYQR